MSKPMRAEPGEGNAEFRNPDTTFEIYIVQPYLPSPAMRSGAKIPESMGKQVYEFIRGLQGTFVLNENIQKRIFFIRDGFTKSLAGKHIRLTNLYVMVNIEKIIERGVFTNRVKPNRTTLKTKHVVNFVYLITPIKINDERRMARATLRESYSGKLTLYNVATFKIERPPQILLRESED